MDVVRSAQALLALVLFQSFEPKLLENKESKDIPRNNLRYCNFDVVIHDLVIG